MPLARALQSYLKQAMDLHQSGAVERAMEMYRDVLKQDPKQADALHLLGAAEWQKGNLIEAEKLMRRAIAVWNKDPGYFADLGGVLKAKGDFADAIVEYKKALAINPGLRNAREGIADAYGKYGYQLSREYRWEEAEAAYRHLLAFRPNDAAALNNLGEIMQHAGEREKAFALYSEALAVKPDFHIVRYNRAICQLALNRLGEGWGDLAASTQYWVPTLDKRENLPWLRLPLWQGEDLRGKKILVWGDQGIGDEILFASMIPDLIACGAQVTIECMDRLVPVFARSFPQAKAIARKPYPAAEDYDFHAPGLWLGRFLRPDFSHFPKPAGYLKADEEKTAKLRARYAAMGKSKIAGIAWYSTSAGRAMHRSMTLRELAAALPHRDTIYINLQYGDRAQEIEDARRALPGFNLYHDPEIDQLRNMDDFAAQIAACDNVITTGNTTAHLAGALGVSAQVFLPIAGLTWYWFENRADSPWYPSLKLLRKTKEGDWSGALVKLA